MLEGFAPTPQTLKHISDELAFDSGRFLGHVQIIAKVALSAIVS